MSISFFSSSQKWVIPETLNDTLTPSAIHTQTPPNSIDKIKENAIPIICDLMKEDNLTKLETYKSGRGYSKYDDIIACELIVTIAIIAKIIFNIVSRIWGSHNPLFLKSLGLTTFAAIIEMATLLGFNWQTNEEFIASHKISDVKSDDNIALVLHPKYDWNNAFDVAMNEYARLELMGYTVLFDKVGSVEEINEKIQETINGNNKIKVLFLGGMVLHLD